MEDTLAGKDPKRKKFATNTWTDQYVMYLYVQEQFVRYALTRPDELNEARNVSKNEYVAFNRSVYLRAQE